MNSRQVKCPEKSSPTYDGIYDKTANIGLVLNAENRDNVVKSFLQTYNRHASHKKQIMEMQVLETGYHTEDRYLVVFTDKNEQWQISTLTHRW